MFETIRSHTIYTPPLGAGSVVLDLGANRGEFASLVRERFGATVHLVEANPTLAEGLARVGAFAVRHCAVAEKPGEVVFNVAANDEGSSILALPSASVYGCLLEKSVTVPARTLESLVAELGVPRIDLLKMDIEGAEVQFLETVPSNTLQSNAQITVEFNCDESFGFGLREGVRRVIRRLRRHGFVCLEFNPSLMNVLFLNRKLLGIPRLKGLVLETRVSPPRWAQRLWGGLPSGVRRRAKSMLDWASGQRASPGEGTA